MIVRIREGDRGWWIRNEALPNLITDSTWNAIRNVYLMSLHSVSLSPEERRNFPFPSGQGISSAKGGKGEREMGQKMRKYKQNKQ